MRDALADKIKNIPADRIKDEPGSEVMVSIDGNSQFRPQTNESAIIQVSEEDERAELARKYGASLNDNSLQKQSDAFAKLLGDEADELPN
mgnify:CR=1 FL=1